MRADIMGSEIRLKKQKWVVAAKRADFQEIGKKFQIDPVIARIIRNRGLTELSQIERYLYGERKDLYDPHLLKDAGKGAEIIRKKIEMHKKIRIIGDYDIDGVEASYILIRALRRCGADVDVAIPDRMKDGYGINQNLIETAYEAGVDTILTCDNGIAAAEPIRMAKEMGMTVIVTDHHDIPKELAKADAVVNPKQSDCPYPFKGLCGAAVAFKFVQLLYEQMGIPVEEADEFLENVGFATVGDVMDLQDENRILVKIGLEMLNHTTNLGMRALILQNQLQPGELKAHHIGFRIGPCLNASGRLDTAQRSLRLLLSEDALEAGTLAAELVSLNEERKDMTALAVEDAKRVISENGMEKDKVLVVFLPDCHESLAGIVAGRIREQYDRPALVLTRGEESAKGSGRSVECYSMFEELKKCDDLLLKYGGHPMAAGFSLEEAKIPEFRRRLNENTTLTWEDLTPKVVIDVPMPVDYVSEGLIQQLDCLEPFGKGNEKPAFADHDLEICSARIFGNGSVVRLQLKSKHGTVRDAVYFGEPENLELSIAEKYGKVAAEAVMHGKRQPGVRMHFMYYPEINSYQGNESIQLRITGFC